MTVDTSVGKITASKNTLNELAGVFIAKAEMCSIKGYEELARYYNDCFNQIFDALDQRHYYDSVKKEAILNK